MQKSRDQATYKMPMSTEPIWVKCKSGQDLATTATTSSSQEDDAAAMSSEDESTPDAAHDKDVEDRE